MIDYHIHSKFSADSKEDLDNIFTRACDLGLSSIAITDHLDPFPDPERNLFTFDKDAYFASLPSYREKYPQLDIQIGAELGMIPQMVDKNRKDLAKYPFDFIIGSVHSVDLQDIGSGEFFPGRTLEEAYRLYYEAMLDCVKVYDFFHVLGHIDYIDRYVSYVPGQTQPLDDRAFAPVIEEVLNEIIRSGRGIELNTGGFRKGLGYGHPKPWILERYHALGGRIITIGSDAHMAKDLASYSRQAIQQLRDAGFKEVFAFKDGDFKKEFSLD